MWDNFLHQVPMWGFALFGVLIMIELALEWKVRGSGYAWGDTACSLTTGVIYTTVRAGMRGFMLALLVLAYTWSPFKIEASVLSFLFCYLAVDFMFYWYHRSVHEVRLGWAAHIVHHSSQKFNLGATAFRQSFAEPFIEPWFFVPVALLGFDPIMILVALEINLIYMFWVHWGRMGKLHPAFEYLFSTPSHHRVHHSNNTRYLDKNYGGTLIVWDRIFGTFEEETETPTYGIINQIEKNNPWHANVHEWVALWRDIRSAKSVKDAIGFALMPPGWGPNGTGFTTRQRQAKMHDRAGEPQSH